jgi:subtilisin family serine protease
MLSGHIRILLLISLVTFSLSIVAIPLNKKTVLDTSGSVNEKFHFEQKLTGKHNYIVRLQDQPVVTYRGDIVGFQATAPSYANDFSNRLTSMKGKSSNLKRSSLKLDMNSDSVQKYQKYLVNKQNGFLVNSKAILGSIPSPSAKMNVAFNGVVMEMSQSQAKQIAAMPEVAYVERERLIPLDTDRGPELIGAPNIWNGSASGSPHYGEGVIVGIIDSGINSDHPSFAETAGDGYVHSNPLGDGVFIGDCVNGFPEMCNNKLIGVRSYSGVTNIYTDTAVFGDNPPPANGEDYDGHGTHVAGTAAGNLLLTVDLLSRQLNVEESDGNVTSDFQFPEISGVAHRANVIAYQVCQPGAEGDTYSGCSTSVMLQAIDDAVADGVDVINMSISGGGNPWTYSIAQGFLAAQEAGIFVAISAGNSGPDDGTTVKNAPWYNSVAASTHGRSIVYTGPKSLGTLTGGDTAAPATIEGSGFTPGYTAVIVYAGDFDNPNDEVGVDSAQCLTPFPEGTFNGQIVVCDRGEIARVQKAVHVAAGGAGGYVLANIQGGGTNLVNDTFVLPGVQISANDGDILKAWLASGTSHNGTISSTSASTQIGSFDSIASFSSRGPNNTVPDIMMPTMTAPGVSIYAAYSDQQFGKDVTLPSPADFAFLQGTSMSSPHAAGAGALIKSAQPSWSPDNIRSALMMTAERNITTNNGADNADIFDMGSGRIQVDQAVKTGLVMEETGSNYRNANPAVGGDPKTLNIPSMGNTKCIVSCSWQRSVTATRNATWSVSTNSNNANIDFSVTPSNFSLLVGESQLLTITATASNVASGEQVIGYVELVSSNSDIPDLHMPAYITVKNSNLPNVISSDIDSNSGSFVVEDFSAIAISELTGSVLGLQKATNIQIAQQQDTDNSSPFDDTTDGVDVIFVTIPTASPLFWIDLENATARDLDLYIGRDSNNDDIADEDEVICGSTSSNSDEQCQLEDLALGEYWILVHNYTDSTPGATDTVKLRYAFIPDSDLGNLTVTPMQNVAEFTPFDLELNWSIPSVVGDFFIGSLSLATDNSPASEGNIGRAFIFLNRIEGNSNGSGITLLQPGTLTTDEDTAITLTINYSDIDNVTNTLSLSSDSGSLATPSGTESGSTVVLTPNANFNGVIAVTATVTDTVDSSLTDTLTFNVTVSAVNDAPTVSASSSETISNNVSTVTLTAQGSDVDNDNLTYSWIQTAGPTVSITNSGLSTAIVNNANATSGTLTFEVSVSDGELSDSATTSIAVTAVATPTPTPTPTPKSSGGGGGSMNWLLVWFLALLLGRRVYQA